VIVTGVALYRLEGPARRRRHRWMVGVFVALTACALMTGSWLLLGARPRLPQVAAPALLPE